MEDKPHVNPAMPTAPYPERLLNHLLTSAGPASLDIREALHRTGVLIDLSGDFGREDGTARALAWCDMLQQRKLSARQTALLEYFRANAWNNRQLLKHRDRKAAWAWDQPEVRQQIYHLRRAIRHAGFKRLSSQRRCEILTNLGNQLNTLGRFVEALEWWGRALTEKPHFGMALGNRGSARVDYAHALYDSGHARVFLASAHDDLSAASAPSARYRGDYAEARKGFDALRAWIESRLDVDDVRHVIPMDGYRLGRSQRERRYRLWCLGEGLFLNPLNDLGAYSIAARDVLTLPDHLTAGRKAPVFIGFFNQMKQEFVSARWLYFQGTERKGAHFSDRDVLLHNTLDFPSYGLPIEHVRLAFRVSYSLLDKIAFFLNEYLKLGIPEKSVYFRTVWYDRTAKHRRALRPEFSHLENLPFRGLFWLAQDLFDPDFRHLLDPDAQSLYDIRNRIEHSYFKVHDFLLEPKRRHPWWTDRLAFSITRAELEARTLRLLKLSRAAMIYLSLGMHQEERKQAKPDKLIMPLHLGTWDDRWKQ